MNERADTEEGKIGAGLDDGGEGVSGRNDAREEHATVEENGVEGKTEF